MCGIAGIVTTEPDGSVEPTQLQAMAAAIAHRGPDGEGFHLAPGVGLASRRLAIIDIAGGSQPLTNEDGTVVCVYNGEIYNFLELRRDLETKGHRFSTATDGEVLCHLYEQEGEAMLDRLRGMFAFALWDARRSRLLVARDRFGIKPLYYARIPSGLAFASELKALLTLPQVRRDLDPTALSDYLTYLYVPSPRTIFASAKKLPPASLHTFERGAVETRTWWTPPAPGQGLDLHPEEAAEELSRRLRETVRSHLVSDVPVGAFLSGGLDSSTIVAFMAEASSPVRTFTVGFEDAGAYDERPHARAVAEHFGCEHAEIAASGSIAEWLPRVAATFDEPFADSSAIPTLMVSELTAGSLPVALSGDGGDEMLSGYDWYRYQQLLGPARFLPVTLRRFVLRATAGSLPDSGRVSGGRRLLRLCADAGLDPAERYLRRVTCFGPQGRRELGALESEESGAAALRYQMLPDGAGPIERMAYADLVLGLPDDMLTKVDRASMAHGLEVRVPFLDAELAGFLWSLPSSLKMRGLQSKWLLRRAMRGILPDSALTRRKQGFGVPIRRWLREQSRQWGPLLEHSSAAEAGYLRQDALRALLDADARGRTDLGHQIWSLLVFETWFRIHAEGGEARRDLVLADLT